MDFKLTGSKVKKRFFRVPKIVAWMFPRRIWFGSKESVYLTFDDGPHPETTPWLLEFLKENNIKVTFFWNGSKAEQFPEFLDKAVKDGHVVGHHGYEHVSGKKISLSLFKSNFDKSKSIIKSDFFRPPYGDIRHKQSKHALKSGEVVMWSWMSYDFDQSLTNEEILLKAIKQVRKRDILVFHENDKTSHRIKEIIPEIIKIIHDKGLNFALVEKKR